MTRIRTEVSAADHPPLPVRPSNDGKNRCHRLILGYNHTIAVGNDVRGGAALAPVFLPIPSLSVHPGGISRLLCRQANVGWAGRDRSSELHEGVRREDE